MDYIYNDKPRYNNIDSMWARKDANLTTMYMKDDMIRGYEKDISAFTTQYFTIEALGDGEVGFMRIYQAEIDYNAVSDTSTFFMYSKNGGGWTSPSTNTFSVVVSKGDKVRFKRNSVQSFALNAALGTGGSGNNRWHQNLIKVSTTCEYKVYGNIMSLFWGDNFAGKTWPNKQVTEDNWNIGLFRGMFSETTIGVSAMIVYRGKMPNVLEGDPLPIESSTDGTGHVDHYLIDASGLYIPLKTRSHVSIADYNSNRNGEYAPSYTFAYMFYNCQKLEHGPIIEDPDCVGYYDFYAMFRQCYSLKDAVYKFDCHFWKYGSNANPAFSQMFMYCLSLEKGPTMIRSWYWLDAMTHSSRTYELGSLFLGQYDHMFNNCQMLKYAPAIYAASIQNDISSATWNIATITKTNSFYDYWGTFPQCFSLKEIAVFYVNYRDYIENYKKIKIEYYNTNGSTTTSGITSKEVYKDYPAVEATYPVTIHTAVSSEPVMNIGECTLHTNVTLTCDNALPFTQTCRAFNDIRKD